MAETQQNPLPDMVRQAREELAGEFAAQSERLEKLEQSLQDLREIHQKLQAAVRQQLDTLAQYEPPPPPVPEAPLEKLLAAVRNLITATLPEQVLQVLTEEAEQMGVRAAVFEVRGKAAWGAALRGFGDQLSEKAFRAMVVPLNQESVFRQVYETGGHAEANAELLKRNRNVLDKFKPSPTEAILLLPIRSAGSVSAIFYSDPGGNGKPLPVDGLKLLTEFSGAQLDRLMALGVGAPMEAGEGAVEAEVVEAEPMAEAVAAEEIPVSAEPEPIEQPVSVAAPVASGHTAAASRGAPAMPAPSRSAPPAAAPAAPGLDISHLSEEEQKAHRDAKRFAKLLVSEIELYNKAKVADGRKNKDIYKRLKTDIERSRQTYEKRFSKTVAKQFDYFHDELVKILASSDGSLLGPDYPGPSV